MDAELWRRLEGDYLSLALKQLKDVRKQAAYELELALDEGIHAYCYLLTPVVTGKAGAS